MDDLESKKLEVIIADNNTISIIFKVIAWIIFVGCIIGGCVLALIMKKHMDNNFWYGILILIGSWFVGVFIFLFIYTISEIIQILHDIRRKIWVSSFRK